MAVFSISVYSLEKDTRGGDTRYAVLQSAIDVLVIRVTLLLTVRYIEVVVTRVICCCSRSAIIVLVIRVKLLFTVRYIDVVVTRVTLLFTVRYRCRRNTRYAALHSLLYRRRRDSVLLLYTVRYIDVVVTALRCSTQSVIDVVVTRATLLFTVRY